MILFVFCVRGGIIKAVSFVAVVDVIVADVFAAIITVDVEFLAVDNDNGVAAIAISADFVSFTFVIDIVVVYFTNVIGDIIFDVTFNNIIIFTVVDVTAIIIDIYFLAAVNVIDVTVHVAIGSFVVNDVIADTGIVISICSTFFLLHCCQRFLLILFLDRSVQSFQDF